MLKPKELIMLAHLRQSGRIKLTKLSKKIHMPVTTLYDKLKNFQKLLIRKHTVLLDFKALGFHTKANIMVKVNKTDRDLVRSYLEKHHLVNSVFRINNGYDFLVEGIFKHVKEAEDFIEKLDEKFTIIDQKAYYIIDEIKREGFLSSPELVEIVGESDG